MPALNLPDPTLLPSTSQSDDDFLQFLEQKKTQKKEVTAAPKEEGYSWKDFLIDALGETASVSTTAALMNLAGWSATNPWTLPLAAGFGTAAWWAGKGAVKQKDPLEIGDDALEAGLSGAAFSQGFPIGGALRKMKAPLEKILGPEKRWEIFNKYIGQPIANFPIVPEAWESFLGGRTLKEMFVPAVRRMDFIPQRIFKGRQIEGVRIHKALSDTADRISQIKDRGVRHAAIKILKNGFVADELEGVSGEVATKALHALDPIIQANEAFRKKLAPKYREIYDERLEKGFNSLFENVADPLVQHIADVTRGVKGTWDKKLREVIKNPLLPEEVRAAARDLYDLAAITVDDVAKNFSSAMDAVMFEKLVKTPGVVSDIPKVGYVKGTRGPFKGLYVQKPVWQEIELMYDVPSKMRKVWNKYFIAPWKIFRVVARTPTQFRNIMTIFIQNDIFGKHSLMPFHKKYLDALRMMRRGDKVWKEFADKAGIDAATISTSELKNFEKFVRSSANPLEKLFDISMHYTTKPFLHVFNNIEAWGKFAKYLHNLEKGMPKMEAIDDALQATFDYSETTKAIKRARETVAPFATWTFNVLRRLPEAMVKHPFRLGKYYLIPWFLTKYSLDQVGMTEEEFQQLKAQLPDYIKNGWYMLLPYRDDKGRLQLFNLTWLIPGLGDIADINTALASRDPSEAIQHYMQNPFVNLTAQVMRNERNTGAPIYNEYDPPATKYLKLMGFIWNQVGPTWAPGGTDWNQIYKAYMEPGSPYSLTPWQAAAAQVGLKVTPVDERVARANFIRKIQSGRASILSEARKKLRYGYSQKDVRKELEQRMEELMKRYREATNP